jgi:23S rRNA (guanosine2251-2'-O)-methyltransferase
MAKEKGIPVKDVNPKKLDLLSEGGAHQGVVAELAFTAYLTLDELLELQPKHENRYIYVLCDEIEDPHNLGAIIRTAECINADGIIIPKRRSASINSTVFKTSAGACAQLPIARVTNLASALEKLKSQNIWIYGADMDGTDYRKIDFSGNICLIIGNEGKGISKLLKKKCDALVSIPMYGKINSLNASVAAGILMYAIQV